MKLQIKILILKIKNSLKRFDKSLILIASAATLCLLLFAIYITYERKIKKNNKLKSEIEYLENIKSQLLSKNKSLKAYKKDARNLNEKVENLVSLESLNSKISKFLKHAEDCNLDVSSYEISKTKKTEHFTTKTVEINLSGEYEDFILFLKSLDNFGLCKLKNFSLNLKNENMLKGKVVCNFYVNKEPVNDKNN